MQGLTWHASNPALQLSKISYTEKQVCTTKPLTTHIFGALVADKGENGMKILFV